MSGDPRMTVGSLFTGIGGLDLGLERAGMTVRWQSEIDPYCCKVLKKHWPHVPNLGDVKSIDWEEVERVDLVCGGFPCQPVSLAGKQLGDRDDRWLWPEFARCLRVLRPRFVVVENVPGLLIRGMDDVLGQLADLGFDAVWDLLPASAFGAPHFRYRTFVVAELGNGVAHNLADTDRLGCDWWPRIVGTAGRRQLADSGEWATEPDVGRVAHGVPFRVDRLRALGNAVVPQVAEWVGRQIVAGAAVPDVEDRDVLAEIGNDDWNFMQSP